MQAKRTDGPCRCGSHANDVSDAPLDHITVTFSRNLALDLRERAARWITFAGDYLHRVSRGADFSHDVVALHADGAIGEILERREFYRAVNAAVEGPDETLAVTAHPDIWADLALEGLTDIDDMLRGGNAEYMLCEEHRDEDVAIELISEYTMLRAQVLAMTDPNLGRHYLTGGAGEA